MARMDWTSLKVTLALKTLLLLWKYHHPATFTEVFSVAHFNILTIYRPNKPTSMSEHWSPLQTLRHHHHQGLGSLSFPPSVLVLMGTSPPFNEPPGSPLSTGRSGVNSRGRRSQDHRLHNASDCWLLMLRRALRGGVETECVCLHLFDCVRIYVFVRVSSCERLSSCQFFLHASWHVCVCTHALPTLVCA